MNYENSIGQDMVTTMMPFSNFQQIDSFLSQNESVWVQISAGQPVVNNSFERIVIATISVSFLILLALSIGWVIIYYFQRFRTMHRRYQQQKQRQDMAERAIKMIKTKKLKKNDELIKNQESCAICIDDFEATGVVMELPCKHNFHKKCIEPWIITKGTCPMCKVNIFQQLGLQTSEDAEAGGTSSSNNHNNNSSNSRTGNPASGNHQPESLESEDNSSQVSVPVDSQEPEILPIHYQNVASRRNLAFENSDEVSSPSMQMTHLHRSVTTTNDIHFDEEDRDNLSLDSVAETDSRRPQEDAIQPVEVSTEVREKSTEKPNKNVSSPISETRMTDSDIQSPISRSKQQINQAYDRTPPTSPSLNQSRPGSRSRFSEPEENIDVVQLK